MDFPIKMAIFNSYVKLPEGINHLPTISQPFVGERPGVSHRQVPALGEDCFRIAAIAAISLFPLGICPMYLK